MEYMKNVSREKLRGGFYTPNTITDFILRWAINDGNAGDILEPSCGDGAFLRRIKEGGFRYDSITAIELDEIEAEKASGIDLPNATVLTGDFYEFCNSTEDKFDLVVGNPPYIRYQYFDKEQRAEAERMFTKAGLKYSKLTNAWVPFVVGSSLLLRGSGKLGLVLPAEILQVSFARQLRNFLAHFYNKINIVSFKKLVFPEVLQEILLMLCERDGTDSHLIEHLEQEDIDELRTLDVTRLKSPRKRIDFKSSKWTCYFLEQEEIDFIERLQRQGDLLPIRSYATVEVGMTTGFNKFFTVPLDTVKEFDLDKYAEPMVGRSVQVPSLIFNKRDWKTNVGSEVRAHFLKFPIMAELEKNAKALEYIMQGENDGIHRGYKCSIRDEWQIVPSAWVSEALFIRRNYIYPKMIVNEAGAYTTDTMHRVTTKKDVNLNAFVASYYNSISLAFAEICGRSHGGGVLELMPNEVEDIPIPYHRDNDWLVYEIDSMIRKTESIEEVLEVTDEVVLKERFGFKDREIDLAKRIRKKLLQRRLNRNRS